MFTYTINKNISVLLTWITSFMLCQPTQREFCVIFFYDFSVNGNDGSTVNRAQGLMIYHRGQLKKSLFII